jgi:4-amino-4-deoxy-L-arabinose transferase-like glycosyltransferase
VEVTRAHAARALADGLRGRRLSELLTPVLFALGLALGAGSLVHYNANGYGRGMLVVWLAALALLAVACWTMSRTVPRIALADVAISAGLALAFAPLYLLALYRWPVQVSSDEVAIMDVSRQAAQSGNLDPLGTSWYLNRPALLFEGWGELGQALGGVDLFHMRLLHALVGLLVIAASYALFRQLLPRRWAVFAAFVLGISHSFFMISRLAMRENTAVLVVVVGLTLLLWGLRNDHALSTFLGGVVAGLGYYVYEPGRVAFLLWVLFLAGLIVFFRREVPVRTVLKLGAIAAAAFVLTVGPIGIADAKIPPGQWNPQHDSLLIYPEARVAQQNWVFASSEWAGYLKNVKFGLSTFNNTVEDHSWIYANRGHGFVDPLTGVLLWLGAGIVAVGLVRRRRAPGALLMLGSFVALWLGLALLINKAPNYTRLLVTLPFVAYLVTEAVRWLAGRWRTVPRAAAIIVGLTAVVLVAWNLAIAWDFVDEGRVRGQDIGTTVRYVDSHEGSGERFYIAQPYFEYEPGSPDGRLRSFADDPRQVPPPIDSAQLPNFVGTPPFALFMTRVTWKPVSTQLALRYPSGRIRNVTPDGVRVVFEVPG